MTVPFIRFGGKDFTPQSDRILVNNYCSSIRTGKKSGQKGVAALQKLKFVALLVCFLIKKNWRILTSQFGKTGRHQ